MGVACYDEGVPLTDYLIGGGHQIGGHLSELQNLRACFGSEQLSLWRCEGVTCESVACEGVSCEGLGTCPHSESWYGVEMSVAG